MSYVQLSEGRFQVLYPLGLRSRFSGVVNYCVLGGRAPNNVPALVAPCWGPLS